MPGARDYLAAADRGRLAPEFEAGDRMKDAETLDAAGLLCPLPVLKARKRLKALPRGAMLRLLATDPAAVIDVPHFCAEAGHDLVRIEEPADAPRVFVIRRG